MLRRLVLRRCALHASTTAAPALASLDAAGVAQLLGGGAKCVVLLGAGASVSAGIPDFRTPGTGLYDNLHKYDLPFPEALFEVDFFREDPRPFYAFSKELLAEDHKPTPMHHFVKLLHDNGQLLRCYTQNIDSLETRAGLPADVVIAAHGNFDTATCIDTGLKVPMEDVRTALFADDDGSAMAALNARAGGLVKSDVVFFGEAMPPKFFQSLEVDFEKADVLIVAGTSLVVLPFASLVVLGRPNLPRVLINLDEVGQGPYQSMLTGAVDDGFDFSPNATRDVFLQGTTDAAAFDLADRLGWRGDLDALLE